MSSKPKPENMKSTLVLVSTPNEIVKVEEFLEAINEKLQLGDTRYNKLLVATTEAVNNGIIHGNKHDPKKKVTLTCDLYKHVLVVRVRDEGEGFDDAGLPDPLAEENLMRDHGRGVFLIRSMMDSVKFRKTRGGADIIMRIALR